MEIRKAAKKDLKQIAEIFRIESAKTPYNKERTPEKALEMIKEDFKGNDLYVSIVDSRIVGFIMVRVDSGIKSQLWINELWISKEYQGRGIGKKIMGEIEKLYKKRGIRTFELVTDTRKGGAYGFYDDLKYKVDKSMVFMIKRIR